MDKDKLNHCHVKFECIEQDQQLCKFYVQGVDNICDYNLNGKCLNGLARIEMAEKELDLLKALKETLKK